MSGRPDYGPGDLVVCVDDRPHPRWGNRGLSLRKVYMVQDLCAPRDNPLFGFGWGVALVGLVAAPGNGFACARFRRLDPEPPEFFAGNVDADVEEVRV